jgi:RNA polymerase sigma factor (sigma-70 family)
MDYNEAQLLDQWEPKVNSMLRNVSIIGLSREDIAQELRIAILKSARGYNPKDTTAKFHTYLHVSMLNVIRSLMAKAQKRVRTISLDQHLGFDRTLSGNADYTKYIGKYAGSVSSKLLSALEDPDQTEVFEEVNLLSLIDSCNLTSKELDFIDLRTQRYRLREISGILGTNSIKLRESIKQKLEWGLKEECQLTFMN